MERAVVVQSLQSLSSARVLKCAQSMRGSITDFRCFSHCICKVPPMKRGLDVQNGFLRSYDVWQILFVHHFSPHLLSSV